MAYINKLCSPRNSDGMIDQQISGSFSSYAEKKSKLPERLGLTLEFSQEKL
jgi:hypothetical protein